MDIFTQQGGGSSLSRYFFDTNTGEQTLRDNVGMELPDLNAVAVEAFGLLRDLVLHITPEGEQLFIVTIRDKSDNVVYRGEMTIYGQRFE